MSDVKISELPNAGEITGDELLPLVQDSETKKALVSDIKAFIDADSHSIRVVVANDAARFALTSDLVKNGSIVYVTSSGFYYTVADQTQLSSGVGYLGPVLSDGTQGGDNTFTGSNTFGALSANNITTSSILVETFNGANVEDLSSLYGGAPLLMFDYETGKLAAAGLDDNDVLYYDGIAKRLQINSASTTQLGTIKTASSLDTQTGTASDMAVTPVGLHAYVRKGIAFTLVSGSKTVSDTSVTANSVILVTLKTASGTRVGNPDIVPTAGVGFLATGGPSDNSTYNYAVIG